MFLKMMKTLFLYFCKSMTGLQLFGKLVLEHLTTWEIEDKQKQLPMTKYPKPKVSHPSPLVFSVVLDGWC